MKIHVLTVKLTCHIPVNPGSPDSVKRAADQADALRAAGSMVGETIVDWRLNRVAAPEPEPVVPEAPDAEPPDGLDSPDFLKRRTAEPEAAE